MLNIVVFTGTRAEYGLLYWLLYDLRADPDCHLQLLVSGTHLSPEFGHTIDIIENDGFKADEKVEILLSSDSAVGIVKSMGLGLIGYSDALERLKPDILIVLGDRFEALAVTQTAMMLRIPVVHLYGGEITEGAYDDAIRHAITKMSYLHCTSTEEYRNRVIQLGESPNRVKNVGALGLDHLKRSKFMTRDELSESLEFNLSKPYFIVTYHSATLSHEDPERSFKALCDVLSNYKDYQVIITYPNADDGGRKIISLIEEYASSQSDRVLAIKSLGQTRYLSAVKYCESVIGNSSSGIIEVPSFNVPTVNIGQRQKGRISAESVIHCDTHYSSILNAVDQAINMKHKNINEVYVNPYGSGHASKKIIDFIKKTDFSKIKLFYNLEAPLW